MLRRWYTRYIQKCCPECSTPLHWYECPFAGYGYECIPCSEKYREEYVRRITAK